MTCDRDRWPVTCDLWPVTCDFFFIGAGGAGAWTDATLYNVGYLTEESACLYSAPGKSPSELFSGIRESAYKNQGVRAATIYHR